MALTRITKGVIKPNENYDTHNINSTGIVTAIGLDVNGNGDISGDLNVGGVLTYEDVTSIDSVGIITAQKDIHVGAGVSAVGVGTFGGIKIGNATLGNNGTNLTIAGGLGIDQTIFHNGDTNTGIDFNTNDRIRFRTGGYERVAITGSAADFAASVNVTQDLDVNGHTNLDNVSIAGVTTMTGALTVSSTTDQMLNLNSSDNNGVSLAFQRNGSRQAYIGYGGGSSGLIIANEVSNGAVAIQGNDGGSIINMLSFASDNKGLATIHGGATIPLDLDVDGHTNLDNVSIAGVSTFTGNIDLAGDIDVDGHTELDNTNIVGMVTATNTSSGVGLKLIDASSKQFFAGGGGGGTPFAGSFTGHDFRIQVGGIQNAIFKYAAGATGNFELGPSSGIGITFNGATGNAGYAGIVTATTFVGNGDFVELDVDGHTNLDHVNIAGVTTFTGDITANGAIDLNADLDVDGHTNLDNVSVAGVTTFTGTAEFDGTAKFDSTITAGGATGSNGQYLKTTGTGVAWASFPTMRTTSTVTASAGQTTFSFTYNVGFLDVFVNGTKLTDSEFTATNGSSVVLAVGCFVGDIVDLISYNTVSGGGGGGAGSITVQDEGSSLSTSAETLNFVGTGIVASGTGSTKTITVNAGTADTTDVRTNTLEVVGVSTFQNTVSVQGANTRLYIGDANSQLYMSGNVLNVDAYARDIQLKTNAGGGDSKDIILHGGAVGGELLRAHGTGDVDILNTLGIGGSITKASGHLDIRASNLHLKNAAGSATYAAFSNGGGAELYFNNTKRFETTNTGANVVGTLTVNGSPISGGGGSGFFSQTIVGIHTLSKVGIGTTNPEFDLDLGSYISQNVSTASTIRIMGDGASSDNTAIRFGAGGSNVDYTLLRVDGRDGTTDGDGNTDLGFALRYMSAGESGTDNRIAFWADNTNKTKYEALSIYNDGRVLVDNGAGGGHGFYGHPPDHFTVRGSSKLDNVRVVGVSTVQHVLPETDSTYDIGTNTVRVRNIYADTLYGDGSNLTGISGGGGTDVGITTNLSGSFTASAGSPSTINTFAYGSGDVVVEYTVYIQNGSNSQTQKLLATRLNTNIDSTQFAVMFTSSLLVQLDATISSGNILLRATPETGVSGSTIYKIKREVM